MSELPITDAFERRLADRLRARTDPAVVRPFDAAGVARLAMAARAARRSRWSRLGRIESPWRERAVARQVAILLGLLAIAAIGLVVVTIGRQPDVPPGPVPIGLRHAWGRPVPIAPDTPDAWTTRVLTITPNGLTYGTDAVPNEVTSTAETRGDLLVLTAGGAAGGCASGDVGRYHWSLEGAGTYLTFAAIDRDRCAARSAALDGPWVRADYQPSGAGEPLATGSHDTAAFDPFGTGTAGQLSYTVPAGWGLIEDSADTFVLELPIARTDGSPADDVLVALFAQPRIPAPFAGADCAVPPVASGVGTTAAELVAAIRTRPGVLATEPRTIAVGDRRATTIDVRLAPGWTNGCAGPSGPGAAVPLLRELRGDAGPLAAVTRDQSPRLIFLDLDPRHTVSITVFDIQATDATTFASLVERAMPIVSSFTFPPPPR